MRSRRAKDPGKEAVPKALVFLALADRPYEPLLPKWTPEDLPLQHHLDRPEDDESAQYSNTLNLMQVLNVHVPNGSQVASQNGKDLKLGMVPGWPDHQIYYKGFTLYIEMKRRKGWHAQQNQLDCMRRLRQQGHASEIAWGCDHALELFMAWKKIIDAGGRWASTFN